MVPEPCYKLLLDSRGSTKFSCHMHKHLDSVVEPSLPVAQVSRLIVPCTAVPALVRTKTQTYRVVETYSRIDHVIGDW